MFYDFFQVSKSLLPRPKQNKNIAADCREKRYSKNMISQSRTGSSHNRYTQCDCRSND